MLFASTPKLPKVFITRKIPEKAVQILQEKCQIRQNNDDKPVSRKVLEREIEKVDGLFCLLTEKIDSDLLNKAQQLKVIGTMSVGYDHIDVKECIKRGILLGNTPDVLTEATAELTMALLLCTSRRLAEAVEQVKNGGWGTWNPMWMCGKSLQSSTIGILGLGRIGLSVAKKLIPFEPKSILYHNGSGPRNSPLPIEAIHVPFSELLSQSDFLLICCSLTDKTRHLFDKHAFKLMKNDAILINTSRGPIIDQDALYDALTMGEIGAVGLDVTDPEPLPCDCPLLKLKNCVILPHIGSATMATRERMAILTAENILAAFTNQPLPAAIANY